MNMTIAVIISKSEVRAMEMLGLSSLLVVLSLILYVVRTVIPEL